VRLWRFKDTSGHRNERGHRAETLGVAVTAFRPFIASFGWRWIGRLCARIDPYARTSWAQEGEDLVLARLLEGRSRGFYVDVGAHHPLRFSNTAYFSYRGWKGINIEPDPEGAALFARFRPRDVTLSLGVGTGAGRLTFHRFDEPALNTFDATLAVERMQSLHYRLLERIEITVMRLDEVLDRHLPTGRQIDFLTVDAEGRDADVLASNDWRRYRPTVVVAEVLEASFVEVSNSEVGRIMDGAGYRPVAMTLNSVFFREDRLQR